MAVEMQGKVGPVVAADSNTIDPRLGRDGGVMVADLHGRYYESVSRGNTFIASTATAGIAHGNALTATGALMLANPAGSGKNLSIQKLFWGTVSGTLGIGQFWWCVGANPATLPAETSAATRVCALLTGSAPGDVAKAYSGVSLTTVPTAVRPTALGYDGTVVATAQTSLTVPLFEEVAGEIVVPPGFFVAVEGIGSSAGTTPLVVLSITYEVVSQ